jgi:Zn-dependent protease with chaperone function
MTLAAVLALLAGTLAWPVPRALASARWPFRCPRAAIVLWQAVGLAGGLAALGAAAAVGVAPLSPHLLGGLINHADHIAAGAPLQGLGIVNLLGLAASAALAARLLTVLGISTVRVLRERRRQRQIVDLAAVVRAEPRYGPLRVLQHPGAVAYCVPGVRPRVVVSEGTLATLSDRELDAVLAHERAHARGMHHLIVQPFAAWQATFPFLRPAREGTAAVSLLVEMLADDVAARRTDSKVLARALARLCTAPTPATTCGVAGDTHLLSRAAPRLRAARLGRRAALPGRPPAEAGGTPVVTRIRRLLDPPPPAPWWLTATVYLMALLLVSIPTAVVLQP